MLNLLDLPDELLFKIIAWVPYRPRSHYHISLTCRRLHEVMATATLSGKVAWCQFSPFMRLLEGYRGRVSTNLSKDELLQTWKSITRYRDWMSFLHDTTALGKNDCLVAISLIHFVAATNKKLVDRHSIGERDTRLSFVFLPKLIECLPPFCVILLRYIIKWTLNDAQDRNTPYDQLQYTQDLGWRGYTAQQPFQSTELCKQAKLFLLNCVLGSTSMLLDIYKPMYNNMADERSYDRWMRLSSINMAGVTRFLTYPTTVAHEYQSSKPLMGCFSFHARLVELCEEEDMLRPIHPKDDSAMSLEDRLTFEYARMQGIDEQIDAQFNDMNSTSKIIRSLDLEDIGRSLKAVFVDLDGVRTEDIVSRVGDRHADRYHFARWGTKHMNHNNMYPGI